MDIGYIVHTTSVISELLILYAYTLANDYGILTVNIMIVVYILICMHKNRQFPLVLLQSVKETIADNAPILGYDTDLEWLSNYNDYL